MRHPILTYKYKQIVVGLIAELMKSNTSPVTVILPATAEFNDCVLFGVIEK